jgi:hypothetical protein
VKREINRTVKQILVINKTISYNIVYTNGEDWSSLYK